MKFNKKKKTKKFKIEPLDFSTNLVNKTTEVVKQERESFNADTIGLLLTCLLFSYLLYRYALSDILFLIKSEFNFIFSDLFYDLSLILDLINNNKDIGNTEINLPALNAIKKFLEFLS